MTKRLFMAIAIMAIFSMAMSVAAIEEVTPTPDADAQPTAQPPTPTAPPPTVAPTTPPSTDADVESLLQGIVQDLQSGSSDAAIDKANQILDIDPENDTAYFYRGVANAQKRDLEAAIDDFSEAIALVPWSWEYYTFRGDTYAQLNQYGDALLDYDEAIFRNPRYAPAFEGRAEANYQLGDTTAGDVDDSIARGIGRLQQGNTQAAIDFFSDAIDNGGDTRPAADAYYNRALANSTDGETQAALDDYTAALDIFENHHDAYLGRGISNRQADNVQAAGEDFLARMEILETERTAETMSIGETLPVEMAYGNVYEIAFDASAGDVLTMTARDANGVGVDPLLALVSPDGTVIAGDDDFGGGLDSALDEFEMPDDGTYTLIISHANGGFVGTVDVQISTAGSQT